MKLTTTIICIIFSNIISAQILFKITPQTAICSLNNEPSYKDRYVDGASPEAKRVIEDICKKIGVDPSGFTLQAANVANAEALIKNGVRYIHYNPLYISSIQKQSQTYWSMIFVLAHEIGHHINGHTLVNNDNETRKREELAADKFAGCALNRLGATEDELQKAMSILTIEDGVTHPARETRLAFGKIGYDDCASGKPSQENRSHTTATAKPPCNTNTGDVYFINMTRTAIRIFLSPQSGWHEMNPRITIEPSETKCILDLKVGVQLFLIQTFTPDSYGTSGYRDYKNEEVRVQPCADATQSPVIIR